MTSSLSQLQTVEDWERAEGSPTPLGATWIESEQAWNFSLFSRNSTGLTLLIYNEDDSTRPALEQQLDPVRNKTGPVWHCFVPKEQVPDGRYYAWRVQGPFDPAHGHRFDPEKILLDPFAKAVHFPKKFSRDAAKRTGPNDGQAPLGVLPLKNEPEAFHEEHVPRPRHTHDAVIYEVHVKGFTARPNSGVTPANRGTFAGLSQKIPYLKELGITIVELLPVQQFDPQEDNYWGYMTLNFFSPHHAYATDDPVQEFRDMVRAFHRAGIEVWLDVVYNHTTEADIDGPTYSLRGIDNACHYLVAQDGAYMNDSGCGNTTRCAHPAVRMLVLQSLRHWITKMGVDGFRFDLASIFARDLRGGVDTDQPAAVHEIGALAAQFDVKVVAEAWDIGSYLLGRSFPGLLWRQWNGKFRDDIRAFVKGDPGKVGALMTRLYGSDDLFPDSGPAVYHAYQSINFLTAHDGFCLYDLVAYNEKHNERNGHGNRDGADCNLSWNCGWEGDENAPDEVLALRRRQVKNFFLLLMLANGAPMFCAGDEFLNTQKGNNNPYNQDNETTWLDWDLLKKNRDIFRFFKRAISFRKSRKMIGRSRFWRQDIRWYGAHEEADLSHDSHSLAYRLHGSEFNEPDLYVMINAWHQPIEFQIQEGRAQDWQRIADTGLESPNDFADEVEEHRLSSLRYEVAQRSIVVLTKTR